MAVSRRAVDEFLDRDFEDYTWLKSVTREAILREMDKFKVPPVFRTKPWTHQLVCLYIALCMPRFLFLLDMGLGKTYIIAMVFQQLLREGKLTRGLVTVPRLVNVASWGDDLEAHSNLGYQLVDCEDIEEKRHRLLYPPKDADLTVIDYASLHLALCDRVKGTKRTAGKLVKNEAAVRRMQALYNGVNIDEIHKLTNHESLWFSIMRQATNEAEFVYATTGTLFGKNVEELWPQFFLVDRGETLGENMGLFRAAFFSEKMGPWKVERHFIKRMSPLLNRMLKHRSIAYDTDEVPEIELPKMPPPILRSLDMSPEQREHYTNALEGLINANGQFSQLDGAWTRMRQICSGYLAWRDENGEHVLQFKSNPKLDELESLLEQMLTHSKVVVAYDYTETGRLISERLKELKIGHEWFYGGSSDHAGQRRRFIEDERIKVFLMNSMAGGEGTDGLQKVARYGVMYESPTGPKLRAQVIKRVHRAGQKHRALWYDLTMRRSLEKGILDDIAEGRDTYDRVVKGQNRSARAFFLS